MSYSSIFVLVLGLLLTSSGWSPAAAQLPKSSPVALAPRRPVASALHVSEAPVIDGVLDERMWQDASPFSGFGQAEPSEGRPGSEATEVRTLYDDDAIYVGVVRQASPRRPPAMSLRSA